MTNFPFLTESYKVATADLPLFKELAWDFERNCIKYDGTGLPIELSGVEALKVWVEKCFRTERAAYLAYSTDYGFGRKKFMAQVMGVGERRAELRREIKDALMTNPYILSVDAITFTDKNHGKDLDIEIRLSTVYGVVTI